VLTVPMAALLYRPSSLRGSRAGGAAAGSAGTSAGPAAASTPAPVSGAPGSHVTLWVLERNKPVAAPVVIGYSDGSNVEIQSGAIKAGDTVITSEIRSSAARSTSPAAFGPGPGGGRG
jgi:hypothetical protein